MTEGKTPAAAKPPNALLALNPKEEAEFKRKVQAVKKQPSQGFHLNPGVVYVGHLPVGLFENQLKAYFQQFGKVLRLRLARSKKTGGSKGYAYVEFECDEVAKIVAETMNNYLMGERLIKCQLLPPEKVHEKLFVGSQRKFKKPRLPAVTRYNKTHTAEEVTKMTNKLLRKESKLRKRLAAHGIDYEFPGFAAQNKRSSDVMNDSTCSLDVTPLCTPSYLERRKSMVINDDDVDDEIIIKVPALGGGDNVDSEEEESEDDHVEEEDSAEREEPSEGDKAMTEEPSEGDMATTEEGEAV